MTQREVAYRLGMVPSEISNYEHGRVTPRLKRATKIAKFFTKRLGREVMPESIWPEGLK